MTALPASARALIEEGTHLAHLVTINPDGGPQLSCVWVGLDGEEVVSAHLRESQQKIRNVRRDPRVVLSVESGTKASWGVDEYLVVYGTARLTEGGGRELLQRLARTYMGPDVTFPGDDAPAGCIMHITVDRVGGVGPWVA